MDYTKNPADVMKDLLDQMGVKADPEVLEDIRRYAHEPVEVDEQGKIVGDPTPEALMATNFLQIAESLRNLANTAKEQMDNGEPVDALTLLDDATRRIQNPDEDDVLDVREFA